MQRTKKEHYEDKEDEDGWKKVADEKGCNHSLKSKQKIIWSMKPTAVRAGANWPERHCDSTCGQCARSYAGHSRCGRRWRWRR